MNPRQLFVLIVGLACLVLAGVRIAKNFSPTPTEIAAAKNRVIWRCRADGYETNLTVAEIDKFFADGKWRLDATNAAVKLVECPKCGKIELEQLSVPVAQK